MTQPSASHTQRDTRTQTQQNPQDSSQRNMQPGPQDSVRIDAVLFDYGMVLTGPPAPSAWARMKQLLSVDEKTFDAAYWQPRDDYDRGTLNAPSYWAAVAARSNAPLTTDLLHLLVDADTALWTVPNQPMIDWAAALAAAGYRTGILSNLGDAMEFGVMEACPWMAGFGARTFTHRYGFAKPEAAAYAIAIEVLGVAAENTLFIDDKPVNVEGARQAGMHAVRYTTHAEFLLLMHAQGFDALLKPVPRADAGAV